MEDQSKSGPSSSNVNTGGGGLYTTKSTTIQISRKHEYMMKSSNPIEEEARKSCRNKMNRICRLKLRAVGGPCKCLHIWKESIKRSRYYSLFQFGREGWNCSRLRREMNELWKTVFLSGNNNLQFFYHIQQDSVHIVGGHLGINGNMKCKCGISQHASYSKTFFFWKVFKK